MDIFSMISRHNSILKIKFMVAIIHASIIGTMEI